MSVLPQPTTFFQNTSALSGAFQDFKFLVTHTVFVHLEVKKTLSYVCSLFFLIESKGHTCIATSDTFKILRIGCHCTCTLCSLVWIVSLIALHVWNSL